MVQSGRLGAKNKSLHPQTVEESRRSCAQDLVYRVDNSLTKHRGVDRPEFNQETVDPFQAFRVSLQSGFCHLSGYIVAIVASNSSDGGPIVCTAYCHDNEDPTESTTQYCHDPGRQTGEYDHCRIVVPIYIHSISNPKDRAKSRTGHAYPRRTCRPPCFPSMSGGREGSRRLLLR